MKMESHLSIRNNELDNKFDASILPENILNDLWKIADKLGRAELKEKLESEEFRRLKRRLRSRCQILRLIR